MKFEKVLIICQNFHKLLSRKNAFQYTKSFHNAAQPIASAGQSNIYIHLLTVSRSVTKSAVASQPIVAVSSDAAQSNIVHAEALCA